MACPARPLHDAVVGRHATPRAECSWCGPCKHAQRPSHGGSSVDAADLGAFNVAPMRALRSYGAGQPAQRLKKSEQGIDGCVTWQALRSIRETKVKQASSIDTSPIPVRALPNIGARNEKRPRRAVGY